MPRPRVPHCHRPRATIFVNRHKAMFSFFKSSNNLAELESAKGKLQTVVAEHLRTLALKRAAGISIDSYGNVNGSRWNAETQYFIDKVILPKLTINETKAILHAGLSNIANEFIETTVRFECKRMHDSGEQDMTVPVVDDIAHPKSKENSIRGRTALRQDHVPGIVSRGLIIREDPLESILSGRKSWEMRSEHTKVRGSIGLVKKGSKAIYGIADIVDSRGPLTRSELIQHVHLHGITLERIDNPEVAKYRFAWVLQNVRRLPTPVPYQHKGGVIFVTLDDYAVAEIAAFRAMHGRK